MPYGITLKKLLDQHDAFDARERRKAEKAAEKERKAAATRARQAQWEATWRKRREAKERAADLRQQRLLDDLDSRRHDLG